MNASSAVRRLGRILILAAVCAPPAGCTFNSPKASLEVLSRSDPPRRFECRYTTLVYDHDRDAEISCHLSDHAPGQWMQGDLTDGQYLHFVILWEPKPGATPMDSTATNLTVRLVLISRGEVGIYEGGGFALLSGRPGGDRLTVSLRDASLKLSDSTSGFRDLLTPATLSGGFTAALDRGAARTYRFATSQFVTNTFGESRFVDGGVTNKATLLSAALASSP